MSTLVADTSGLVSIGVVAGSEPDPLDCCLDAYELTIPEAVVDELEEIAAYEDVHGRAASAVLDSVGQMYLESVALDETFPLDAGENAAVTLANEIEATLLLCDEFNSLGLIHASLANTRLVTTPTLLSVLVRTGWLSSRDALSSLDEVSRVRSWESNSYVERARSLLESD